MRTLGFAWLLAIGVLASPPPTWADPAHDLSSLAFLVGRWEATGGGQPGEAAGSATFETSLQGQVLIRRSFAEYPATSSAPASRHDDLMIIYAESDGTLGADYYDSEGHRIHYTVDVPSPGHAVFLSDKTARGPRYRLTYELHPSGHLGGEFAIAPPDHPETFSPYLTWDSVRADGTAPGKGP